MHDEVTRADQLAGELPGAIERGQLSVRYQPIVNLADGTIVAVEALARWCHPRWGTISPSIFVPIAERHGLIAPIDRWVLQRACEQTTSWQQRIRRQSPLAVNVNLSARLIHEPTLLDDVRRTLRASGLDPGCLRLEITESVLMQDSVVNIGTLHALRQLGVGIAIDDFGTGYSSLSYLRWLPATILKLDRSFIAPLGRSPRDAAIVRGVLAIARDLGMSVTAEGIESELQRDQLQRFGCDRGQGYFFAPPLPPDELEELLRRERPFDRTSVASGADSAPAQRHEKSADPRVLVVDDDVHIRRLTTCALEMDGYDVVAAADGMSALKQLQRRPPNVIVLDMMMPIMDGWQFSEVYRELPGPHAPIVVLTAAANAAGCAAQVGAAGYLAKPFEVDALLTMVDRLVPAAAS